jgi:hypothetical protein
VSAVDLDDVSGCPLGHRCEACGAEAPGLAVVTASLGALGVACLTMCPRCAQGGSPPPVTVSTAVRLVGQHCVHLGITVDHMADVLGERR